MYFTKVHGMMAKGTRIIKCISGFLLNCWFLRVAVFSTRLQADIQKWYIFYLKIQKFRSQSPPGEVQTWAEPSRKNNFFFMEKFWKLSFFNMKKFEFPKLASCPKNICLWHNLSTIEQFSAHQTWALGLGFSKKVKNHLLRPKKHLLALCSYYLQ